MKYKLTDKTLLVIVNEAGIDVDEGVYCLIVADTGEVLASHFCSGSSFALGDLYENRPERIEVFQKRFGEVEVRYLSDTDISFDELVKRNIEFFHNSH